MFTSLNVVEERQKTLEWLWSEQSEALKQKEKLIVGFRAENAIGIFGMQIAQEFNHLLMLTGFMHRMIH